MKILITTTLLLISSLPQANDELHDIFCSGTTYGEHSELIVEKRTVDNAYDIDDIKFTLVGDNLNRRFKSLQINMSADCYTNSNNNYECVYTGSGQFFSTGVILHKAAFQLILKKDERGLGLYGRHYRTPSATFSIFDTCEYQLR